MFVLITTIILIASILLVGVVLVQNSKGGGLASGFAAQNQIMGVRKTTDFIEKATWSLVAVVIVLSVLSAAFLPKNETVKSSELKGQYEEMQQAAPALDPNSTIGGEE
ncbi:MAG: preprotein translocase subunit SecG [Prevotellaceae bacterium]|jgi:preprotein translocase subunit SecG|nr:preprotein translocase subunit SecG [Prevotellaceae bacterium]